MTMINESEINWIENGEKANSTNINRPLKEVLAKIGVGAAVTDNSVTENKIANDSVTEDKIANNSVTIDKLANDVTNLIDSKVAKTTTISTNNGLTGGGDLTTDRTIGISGLDDVDGLTTKYLSQKGTWEDVLSSGDGVTMLDTPGTYSLTVKPNETYQFVLVGGGGGGRGGGGGADGGDGGDTSVGAIFSAGGGAGNVIGGNGGNISAGYIFGRAGGTGGAGGGIEHGSVGGYAGGHLDPTVFGVGIGRVGDGGIGGGYEGSTRSGAVLVAFNNHTYALLHGGGGSGGYDSGSGGAGAGGGGGIGIYQYTNNTGSDIVLPLVVGAGGVGSLAVSGSNGSDGADGCILYKLMTNS